MNIIRIGLLYCLCIGFVVTAVALSAVILSARISQTEPEEPE